MEPEVRVAMTTPDLMITHEPSATPWHAERVP